MYLIFIYLIAKVTYKKASVFRFTIFLKKALKNKKITQLKLKQIMFIIFFDKTKVK